MWGRAAHRTRMLVVGGCAVLLLLPLVAPVEWLWVGLVDSEVLWPWAWDYGWWSLNVAWARWVGSKYAHMFFHW